MINIIKTKQNQGQYNYRNTLAFILFASVMLSSVVVFPISGASGYSNVVFSQERSFSSPGTMPLNMIERRGEMADFDLNKGDKHNAKIIPISNRIPLAPPIAKPAGPMPSYLAAFSGCHSGGPANRNVLNPEWAPVEPTADFPQVAEGIVDRSSIAYKDLPYDHRSHDLNFDTIVDANKYQWLGSDGDRKAEDGRPLIFPEMEIGNRPTGDTSVIPEEFWPSVGDKVWIMGRWVWDCGHYENDNYKAELHPVYAVAATRPQPTIFPGDKIPSDAVRTSIFITTQGGYYDGQYNMALFRNYEFDIDLPLKPSPDAELRFRILSHPFSQIIKPFAPPIKAPPPLLVPVPPNNPTKLHVTIPLAPSPTEYVFDWNQVPGQDSEKLRQYLNKKFLSLKMGFGFPYPFPTIRDPSPFSKIEPDHVPAQDIGLPFTFTKGDIKKIDQNTIRIGTPQVGQNCVTLRLAFGLVPGNFCAYTLIKLDSTKTNAVVTFVLERPGSNIKHQNYNAHWRYPLFAKNEGGSLKIYDYDHNRQIKYGAIIAAGWHEPVPTQDYRVLRITFGSVKINNNHAFNGYCADFGLSLGECPKWISSYQPNLPARWRLWVSAGGHWLPGVMKGQLRAGDCEQFSNDIDGVRAGDNILKGQSVDVIVPDSAEKLHIQTTGWRSGCMDMQNMYMRTEPPNDIGAWADYKGGIFCREKDLGHCPALPIGYIWKDYTKANNNYGAGTSLGGKTYSEDSVDYYQIFTDEEHSKIPGYETTTAKDFTLTYRIQEIDRFPTPSKNSGFLIQSTFGKLGNFEMVVPNSTIGGIDHYWHNNDANPSPWSKPFNFGKEAGIVNALSLIQSNFKPSISEHGNFEVIARVGDRLVQFWKDPLGWHGPLPMPSDGSAVSGNPALIQSKFGNKGNFELAVPRADTGFNLYWRDNDKPQAQWNGPFPVAMNAGHIDALSLIQSNFGVTGIGNLELVARIGDRLALFWKEDKPQSVWQGPVFLPGSGYSGNPSMIQTTNGRKGNFELVIPRADNRGFDFFWRNNDDRTLPWMGPYHVATNIGPINSISLIQSNFGSGNLEAIASVGQGNSNNKLVHFWHENGAAPTDWKGPIVIN